MRCQRTLGVVSLVFILSIALSAQARAQATIQFTEVSVAAGLSGDFYRMFSDHGLGINWIDYDNDGWPDIFSPNGRDLDAHLFHNNGDGTFTRVDELLPALPNVELVGSVFADYDHDGDKDIYIVTDDMNSNSTWPANLLLQNQWVENGGGIVPGQPLFQDVAGAAGVDEVDGMGNGSPAIATGFFDFDLDGDLDLYVCHWRRFGANGLANEMDSLYRNLGNGTFEDASSLLYPAPDATQYRPCLALITAHLNDDKYPDVYVGNVMKPVPYSLDQIYQNQSGTGFVDRVPSMPGIGDDSGAAMSVTVADIDHDLDWDIYLTDVAGVGDDGPGANPPFGNPFYRSLSSDLVSSDITLEENSADLAGVEAGSSWPSTFFDADHDTFEDLHVGHAGPVPDIFYLNNTDGTFSDISAAAGFNVGTRSRGSALADYDNDGDLDLAVVNQEGPLELWRNDTINPGNSLKIKLAPGAASNPDGVGTLAKVTIGGTVLMRQLIAGDSAHSQGPHELHFGIGAAATVDQVTISWPNLVTPDTVLSNVPAGAITVDETTGSVMPEVSITAPANNSVHAVGASISFSGSAIDLEDGDLTASLAWASDLDGAIGTGGSFSIDTLSVGTHLITASATDLSGLTGSAHVTVIVGNSTPIVAITSPADGSGFAIGSSISFAGTANDFEDGDISASLNWTSDLDGAIGTGAAFNFTLSEGIHLITAEVTDNDGATASHSITVTVGNMTPMVTILSPTLGPPVDEGTLIDFIGTATDAEDGDITASLAWTSDIDGAIGTGGSFSLDTLSPGGHTITAQVTDSGGATGSAGVAITINPSGGAPTITLKSIGAEDGMIQESSETSGVGGRSNSTATAGGALRVGDASDDSQLLLITSFDTSAIPAGSTITNATLRLRRGQGMGTNPFDTHGACQVDVMTGGFGGDTALAASDFEAAATATAVATMTNPVANGDWSEGIVNAAGLAAINVGGTTQFRVHFAIDDDDDQVRDYLGFHPGEAGDPADQPELVVTYLLGNATPSVSITSPADGAEYGLGAQVDFAGTATDAEDGDLTAFLDWSSDIDGAIGTGGSVSTTTLSEATHVITAEVTDMDGATGSASITITVGNLTPTVTITSPADGLTVDEGTLVDFMGTANDPEDGDVTASLDWTSSVDGALGTGGSFSLDTLSVGTHTITAEVTDSGGATGSDSVSVTINPTGGTTVVTFTSVALEDGMVQESSENSGVGDRASSTASGGGALRIGDASNDSQLVLIVSFDTSSIPAGSTVTAATLRLLRGQGAGGNPFDTHGSCLADVHTGGFGGDPLLASSDFEAAATATGVATLSNAPSNGDWSEGTLDVNGLAAINLAGTTQFRVYFSLDDDDDGLRDYVGYYSGDNGDSANHPQLEVTYVVP